MIALAAAGGSYYILQHKAQSASAIEETVNTAQVRRGELIISATGSGEVVAAREYSLGFQSSGVMRELNVQVGDTVVAAEVLAHVDDLSARQALTSAQEALIRAQAALDTAKTSHAELFAGPSAAELLEAQAVVTSAEEKLADLTRGATAAELAQAEAAVATAQVNYDDAKSGPTAVEIRQAELSLESAKNSLWSTQMSRDATCGTARPGSSDCDRAEASVLNGEISVQLAQFSLDEVRVGSTVVEIQALAATLSTARQTLADLKKGATAAELAAAKATLATAQEALADLQAGASIADIAASDKGVQQAELAVTLAEMDLTEAQDVAAHTVITAPIAGVVTAVNADLGETVSTDAVLTVSDISQPTLKVYFDEADMDMVVAGYEIEASFDSMPDQIFTGTLTTVSPVLASVDGVNSVEASATLDAASFSKPQNLLVGMRATVDVIGGRAESALLVPVEALRDMGDGTYAVFVMRDGALTFQTVEVGLMDLTYAEIRSGLALGDSVSTGLVETKS